MNARKTTGRSNQCLRIAGAFALGALLSAMNAEAAMVAGDANTTKVDAAPLRVALTFDDSLKDHLLVAAPMLEERGWRGTFCIVTDWVGKGDKYLSWDDVRELVRRGHEIATHTKSHRNLVSLLENGQEAEVRREILESADKMASETGFAPRFMFSPFVRQNETTARICRDLGLRQAEVPRYNFGSNNCDRAATVVGELRQKGAVRADFLHHGV